MRIFRKLRCWIKLRVIMYGKDLSAKIDMEKWGVNMYAAVVPMSILPIRKYRNCWRGM